MPEVGSLARDHALATAFVARLDARTPLPIANDPAFHHALFREVLEEPWTAAGDATGSREHTSLPGTGGGYRYTRSS